MREAINQALRHLQLGSELDVLKAIEVLKKAHTHPRQKPVAWMDDDGNVCDWECPGFPIPLYTATPRNKWVGLTDQEISDIWFAHGPRDTLNGYDFARAIQTKFMEKNK